MGRPHASWMQKIDQHLKEMGMGQASAWGMARWTPLEYRQKVDSDTLLRRMLQYSRSLRLAIAPADAWPIPISFRCGSTCCNHEARGRPICLLHS